MTRDPASPSDGPTRRALISVSDRTGLADFARGLCRLGWELVASRGTAGALAAAGLAVTDAADYTGSPPMLGHRVVTLHPRLHGGILADRDDPAHQSDLDAHGIDPIDLVVVNLYPFADRPGTETIDVGGPALVRAAAKNCAHVGVVTDPSDYAEVLAELEAAGNLSDATRRRLARRAFALTAAYDTAITTWLDQPAPVPAASAPAPDVTAAVLEPPAAVREPPADAPGPATSSPASDVTAAMPALVPASSGPATSSPASDVTAAMPALVPASSRPAPSEPGADDDSLPPALHLTLERAAELRYGENPHQRAARYRRAGRGGFWDGVVQHGGLPLSYLNLLDAAAAWRLACDLGPDPAAVIVKHANPCGAATAEDLAAAYDRAYRCDPRSAFGGIVAFNRAVDSTLAEAMAAAAQADVVIAPGYTPEAVERLTARRQNTRLLQAPAGPAQLPPTSPAPAQHDPAQAPRTSPAQPSPTTAQPSPAQAPAGSSEPPTGPSDSLDLVVRSLGSDGADVLVQDAPRFDSHPADWTVVTARRPSESEMADAAFAWKVCAHTASNAVVLARDRTAWGIGAGQQNRVEAGLLAAARARGRAAGGACASDGFYPFADGLQAAADAGAAVVVQPGGSVNDETVIAAADRLGLSMLLTGERQFRH